jgi:hypothetical protein
MAATYARRARRRSEMSGMPWMLQIPTGLELRAKEIDRVGELAKLLPGDRGLLIVPQVLNTDVSNLDRIWRAAILNRREDLQELLSKQPSVDDIWYAAGDLARAALDERLMRIIDGRKP